MTLTILSCTIVGVNKNVQAEKACTFVEMAFKSLHKHFLRWGSLHLLPAGLLAETPFAKAIAKVILGQVTISEQRSFEMGVYSTMQKDWIKVTDFEGFVWEKFQEALPTQLDPKTEDCSLLFPSYVLDAAKTLLSLPDDTPNPL